MLVIASLKTYFKNEDFSLNAMLQIKKFSKKNFFVYKSKEKKYQSQNLFEIKSSFIIKIRLNIKANV